MSSANYYNSFRKKSAIFAKSINVEPVVFLLCFAAGIIGIPMTDLILFKTCLSGSYFFTGPTYNSSICANLTNYPDQQAEVQETVQKFNSLNSIMNGILMICVTVFLGSWCDSGQILPL